MRRTVLHQTAVLAMTMAVIMGTFSAYADPAGNLQTQTVQAGFGIQEQKGGHGMNFGAFGCLLSACGGISVRGPALTSFPSTRLEHHSIFPLFLQGKMIRYIIV